MPSTVRATAWFIRITAPWEHLKQKVEIMKGWIDYNGMMVGYHNGSKTEGKHCHICLKLKSELQKQSLDTRLRKLFDVERGKYSSKPWDGAPQAMSYLWHDDEGQVFNGLGLTDAQIEELKRMNNVIQEAMKQAKERASYKVVQYVLERIKESGIRWTAYEIGWEIQKQIYSGRFHEPGDYGFEKYVNEILSKQCENEEELSDMFAARMRRMRVFNS